MNAVKCTMHLHGLLFSSEERTISVLSLTVMMVSIQKIDAERATVEMFFNTDKASFKTMYCNTGACLSLTVLPLYNM